MDSKMPWTAPEVRRIPYAEAIEMLRSALKQAESSNDPQAAELVRSLRRQLQELELKNPAA